MVAVVGEAGLGEGGAQRLDGDHGRGLEVAHVGPTGCGGHQATSVLLGQQFELGLVLGEAGDQLHHDVDTELAAGGHLRVPCGDRLLTGDVDARGAAASRVLAPAGHEQPDLGQLVEVVTGDIGVQAEHVGDLACAGRHTLGPQSAVDAGPRGHTEGPLHGVVGDLAVHRARVGDRPCRRHVGRFLGALRGGHSQHVVPARERRGRQRGDGVDHVRRGRQRQCKQWKGSGSGGSTAMGPESRFSPGPLDSVADGP